MNSMHLSGSEDVLRAGHAISGAADQINRAASSFDNTGERLMRSLEDHAIRVGDVLTQATVTKPLRSVMVTERRVRVVEKGFEVVEVGQALFHAWGSELEEFENGGVQVTVAIVEFPDGSIKAVLPDRIRFEVPA